MSEPARALARFESLLKGRMPVVLIPSARHGRALALYGLKRYAEARDEWVTLLASNPPRPLAGEATFWLGDTLGRLGDEKGAVSRLKAFTADGPQPLTEQALLSLGWWSRAAGQPADAVQAYRALLSAYPQSASAPWARAGLVLALLDQNDFTAAREEAKQLEASSKTSPLVLPTLLSLRRWAADKGMVEEGQALDTDLLARTLDPETRAWVLLLSGELARQAGNAGEARDRLELVRSTGVAAPAIVQQAELRLAQIDFDAREYAQAQTAALALLNQPLADDLRAAALLLVAESAYWARNWDQAVTSYSRFVSDFPKRPEAPAAGFALGWAELRRGRLDAARDRWATFAREAPADPRAGEALLLAAELAAKAGDRTQARAMLDRVVGQYPGTRAGRGGPAQPRDPLAQCWPRDRCPGRAEPGRPGKLDVVVSAPRPRARGEGLGPPREQAARGGRVGAEGRARPGRRCHQSARARGHRVRPRAMGRRRARVR